MVSAEGEIVNLRGYKQNGDDCETWFRELEEKMKEALIRE